MELLRYRSKALGALAVKFLPLVYGGTVILFVNTHLPRSELGVYSLAMATFFVVSLIGKSFALFPLIKFHAEGGSQEGIWTAGVTYWVGLQLFGAALLWILAPAAPAIFHAPGLDAGLHWITAIILAFIPRDLASALLQSRRELGRMFFLDACYFLVAAGGIALYAYQGILESADSVLKFNLLGAIVSTAAAPLLCWGRIPGWGRPTSSIWAKTALYGRDSLGIGVGDLVYTQLDYHLLGFFVGAKEVALYFAAKSFFRFYNAVTQAINLLVFPTSANLFARGEIAKLRELVEKVLGGYLGLLLLVNILVLISADWLVALVYRGIFPEAANILRLFVLASFFEPLYMISENVLYGIGKPRAVLVAMWSSLVLFILLGITLIPAFHAAGGAMTILGTLFSLASITMIYLHRELQITPLGIAARGLAMAKSCVRR